MTEIQPRQPSALEGPSLKPLICLRDLSNYRGDGAMPESPDTKPPLSCPVPGSISPLAGIPSLTVRPHSTNSSLSGMTAAHSPQSSLSGRTPSPPVMGNTGGSAQQLPPACGARQLSKLKRFLTTLQQFGSDISPEIGDRVRSLVLGLVNSHLSIEEFHAKLQEATNFPLRPFVIPFLKTNLPLLQRELLQCARLAKQTPQQYLAHNEHILFDPSHSPIESHELLSPDFNENGKRPSPDRAKENGLECHIEPVHAAKRPHTVSPVGSTSSRISPGTPSYNTTGSYPNMAGPMRLEDISVSRELRERERERADRDRMERDRAERERHFSFSNLSRQEHFDHLDRLDDDWKTVENMLHCIVGMVDKCKRVLASLQERSQRDREEMSTWLRRQEIVDADLKKRDYLAGGLRGGSEDRLGDVKRRAEDAVNEVKRQAVSELQKAVAAAESKANDLVHSERLKMERELAGVKKQTHDDILSAINKQEESSESCWNCGRKASETCSGCNVARYCGSFCQHKDWENHHRVCGQGAQATLASRGRFRHHPEGSTDGTKPGSRAPSLASLPKVSAAPKCPPTSLLTQSQPSAKPETASSISPSSCGAAPSPSNTSPNSQTGSRSNSPGEDTEAKV